MVEKSREAQVRVTRRSEVEEGDLTMDERIDTPPSSPDGMRAGPVDHPVATILADAPGRRDPETSGSDLPICVGRAPDVLGPKNGQVLLGRVTQARPEESQMEDEPQKDCPTPKSRGEAIWVSLDRLVPDPALPPIVVSEGTIKLVANQMKSAGQFDPLRARPGADPDAPFRVVDGRVRLAVLELLGWDDALITVEEPLDDREVLYRTAVRSAGGRPRSPLEMAWITFHMVEKEKAAGSDAPQRVVARRLRSDLGSGSEPTVSRRIKITRHISPEWLASVEIDPADLIHLSQRALGKVAELEDGDARARALRLKAGLTDETGEPCANASPRVTVRRTSARPLHLSLREALGQHWSRKELRTLVDAIEPVLEEAQNLLVGDASGTNTADGPSKGEHPDLLVSVTGALVASLAREEALRCESARRGRWNLRGCLRRALSTARTTAGRLLRAFAHHAARFHRG